MARRARESMHGRYFRTWLYSPGTTPHLDSLVSITDDSNEQAEHHIDEQRNEGVQVKLAENPHSITLCVHLSKSHEHVISIDQREHAF